MNSNSFKTIQTFNWIQAKIQSFGQNGNRKHWNSLNFRNFAWCWNFPETRVENLSYINFGITFMFSSSLQPFLNYNHIFKFLTTILAMSPFRRLKTIESLLKIKDLEQYSHIWTHGIKFKDTNTWDNIQTDVNTEEKVHRNEHRR